MSANEHKSIKQAAKRLMKVFVLIMAVMAGLVSVCDSFEMRTGRTLTSRSDLALKVTGANRQKEPFDPSDPEVKYQLFKDLIRLSEQSEGRLAALIADLKVENKLLNAELKAENKLLNDELKAENKLMNAELKSDIKEIISEIKTETKDLKSNVSLIKNDLFLGKVFGLIFLVSITLGLTDVLKEYVQLFLKAVKII
jgi:hypothetical protein